MFRDFIRDYLNSKFVRGKINRNHRTGALHRAWGHVYSSYISGDYFEFGVYQGASLVESYKNYLDFCTWIQAEMKSPEPWRVEAAKSFMDFAPKFYALDTFEGMPDNDEGDPSFRKGCFRGTLEEVAARCERVALRPPQLQVFKGLFKETARDLLVAVGGRKGAIINIDCDIYESTRDVLEIIPPLIRIGTVLLVDDYNAFAADNNKGQRRAFREFCKRTERQFEPWFAYGYTGQSFLCVA